MLRTTMQSSQSAEVLQNANLVRLIGLAGAKKDLETAKQEAQRILDSGTPIDGTINEFSPLVQAVFSMNTEMVKFFLEKGAKVTKELLRFAAQLPLEHPIRTEQLLSPGKELEVADKLWPTPRPLSTVPPAKVPKEQVNKAPETSQIKPPSPPRLRAPQAPQPQPFAETQPENSEDEVEEQLVTFRAADYAAFLEKHQNLLLENKRQRERLAQADGRINIYAQVNGNLQNENHELKRTLESNASSITNMHARIESLTRDKQTQGMTIDSLKSERKNLTETAQALQRETHHLQNFNTSLQTKNEALNKTIQKLSEEIIALTKKNETLTSKNETLTSRNSGLMAENNRLKSENETKQVDEASKVLFSMRTAGEKRTSAPEQPANTNFDLNVYQESLRDQVKKLKH